MKKNFSKTVLRIFKKELMASVMDQGGKVLFSDESVAFADFYTKKTKIKPL